MKYILKETNIIMSAVLNEQNKTIFISLSSPYENIKKVISFSDELEHDSSVYFNINKYFRYSYNKINFSNWIELSDSNLQMINIPDYSELWLEYKYELTDIEVGESVEFKNLTLEIIDIELKKEHITCNTTISNECCDSDQLIVEECCGDSLFNPYEIDSAVKVLKPLVKLVSDTFGFEVEYYKTNPRLNSKDTILNEYSVYNIEKKCYINILIPDNTLPTKELQFNSLEGIALPDIFEIHLVREAFEKAFGVGEVPRVKDYLYFPYLKRIYRVNSVMLSDENPFNTATYFRINLTDYVDGVNMIDEDDVNFELDELIEDNTVRKFGEKKEDEIKHVKKPDQYVTLNKEQDGSDPIRKYIDNVVLIGKHNIINKETYQVVSDYYYDFQPLSEKKDVVEYKYDQGLKDEFAFTFMLNLKQRLTSTNMNVRIKKISDSSGTYTDDYYYNGLIVETFDDCEFEDGNVIYLKNTSYYNGINVIAKVINSKTFIIDKAYKGFNGGVISKAYEQQKIIDNKDTFSVIFIEGYVLLKLNDKLITHQISVLLGKWYYYIINFSNQFKQLALFVYDEDFKQIYNKVGIIENAVFNRKPITLVSGKYLLSNIRLFRVMVEEEQHVSVLSQNIVVNSELALITDNARPQIRLKNYGNSR